MTFISKFIYLLKRFQIHKRLLIRRLQNLFKLILKTKTFSYLPKKNDSFFMFGKYNFYLFILYFFLQSFKNNIVIYN